MRIEMGESLLYSWLRHIKGCQLVQTNWKKPSLSWEMKNEDTINTLLSSYIEVLRKEYNKRLYKSKVSAPQLLLQSEIDVLGASFDGDTQNLYAIDVNFDEFESSYNDIDKAIIKVAQKILTTVMFLYGHFDKKTGDIIFVSPRIDESVISPLDKFISDIQNLLYKFDLTYNIRIIANGDFYDKIMQPVIDASKSANDSKDLFMRSIQIYSLFSNNRKSRTENNLDSTSSPKEKDFNNINGYNEMKIGLLVRSTLTRMLANHEISKEEIELMQTAAYSKKTFHLLHPLLRKTSLSNGEKVTRYWSTEVEAYGEKYFICSEWYETPSNNDRPYFMKWLALRQ